MASNFTFGGTQDVLINRSLAANDKWLPDPANTTVRNLAGGTTIPGRSDLTLPTIAEMAATTTSTGSGAGTAVGSGFFQMEDVPVTVWFTGLAASTVALQFLNPITTTWETIIANAAWLTNPAQVILFPGCIWRVGCITYSADTLGVNVAFIRSDFRRHA